MSIVINQANYAIRDSKYFDNEQIGKSRIGKNRELVRLQQTAFTGSRGSLASPGRSGGDIGVFDNDSKIIVGLKNYSQGQNINFLNSIPRTLPVLNSSTTDFKYSNFYQKYNFSVEQINLEGLPQIKDNTFIKFDDIQAFNPVKRIEITNTSFKMELVGTSKSINSEFIKSNQLEPFEIRNRDRTIFESITSVSNRAQLRGPSATIASNTNANQNGSIKKGSALVRQFKEVLKSVNNQKEKFDDTRQPFRLTNKILPVPSREDPEQYFLRFFDDTIDYSNNSYQFMTQAQKNELIKNSFKDISEIGSRYESMTAGFIYENTTIGNTTLGTDSLAFGGLKR